MPSTVRLRRSSGPRVSVLAYAGMSAFELGIVTEVFGLPRPELGVDWYDLTICAPSTVAAASICPTRPLQTAVHSLSRPSQVSAPSRSGGAAREVSKRSVTRRCASLMPSIV